MAEKWKRAFVFADMNSFFAGVEQMDDPALRGKPVGITNGMLGTCIITCSYEARAYGVKSVTNLKKARELCPHLIRKPARPERYVQISTRIMQSMEQFTPEIEIFSVDEVFLDVTKSQNLFGDPLTIARRVKDVIYSVSGVKASVGVADSKMIAKWAAKLQKPDGLVVIEPGTAKERLRDVPVTDICGINKGIANHLAAYGAYTCGDVDRLPMNVLGQRFGNVGRRLHMICAGFDPEPITGKVAAPKSIGHGKVIPPNTRNPDVIETYLLHMSFKVAVRLRLYGYKSGHYSIGLRTKKGWCAGQYQVMPTANMMDIFNLCVNMLNEQWNYSGVNQVQVTAIKLVKQGQADLFSRTDLQQQQINDVIDAVNARYGELALAPAKLLNRSTMPNVIAPSWKPFGHRETILSGKYSEKTKQNKAIPFSGRIT